MTTPSLANSMACIYRGDWQGVGEILPASAEKLAKIRADFLIRPDNTIHQTMPYVLPHSPLPWVRYTIAGKRHGMLSSRRHEGAFPLSIYAGAARQAGRIVFSEHLLQLGK